MKSLRQYIALCLIGLSTIPALANDNETNRPVNSTRWVAPESKSFIVRTLQGADGNLQIWVNNNVKQGLTVRLVDSKGNEVFFEPLSRRPQAHAMLVRLDEIPDGEYQLEVLSNREKVVKAITLNTPETPARQAKVQVLK